MILLVVRTLCFLTLKQQQFVFLGAFGSTVCLHVNVFVRIRSGTKGCCSY